MKIRITLQDLPDGTVKIDCDPTAEALILRVTSKIDSTPAVGLALGMINRARQISRSNEPTNKVLIPKIGRA